MIDLAITVVSSFLVPYLKEGAGKIAQQVTDKVSKSAADHVVGIASGLWQRVTAAFTTPDEKDALRLFEKYPDSADKVMTDLLARKLDQDSDFAKELAVLVNKPSPDGSGTGAQIMNASVAGIFDARGAHISGGTQAGVIVNRTSPISTGPPTLAPGPKE